MYLSFVPSRGSDVGYLATVQIGTPPQNFVMLMDSGSADMWVGSENCQSQQGGCVRPQISDIFVINHSSYVRETTGSLVHRAPARSRILLRSSK